MRPRAYRRSMSMQKRDTMHPSSKNLLLVALFCALCATLTWAQSPQNAPAQNQQQNNQLQPVQDLTPPTDAEAERLATPPPAPNQPRNTSSVPVPEPTTGNTVTYLFKKDVEDVMLYDTVVDPHNR